MNIPAILQSIQSELNFSYGIMAQDLGLHKPTWQGYVTGRRKCPNDVARAAIDSLRRTRLWQATMDARIDAALNGQPVPNDIFLP